MRRLAGILTVLVILGGAAFWWVTRPEAMTVAEASAGDAEAGARIFAAAGCASCHEAPEAEGEGPPVLSGGQSFETQFGTFHAPNISPSPEGIGDWSDAEIIRAIRDGVSRGGSHYYPVLPYAEYGRAEPQDLADLVAYMRTLPASDADSPPNEVSFPFGWRRLIGGWKWLFVSDDWVMQDPASDQVAQGRYLVEALGHCAECHTPRNALGGYKRGEWLAGGPDPEGDGTIPNITPGGLDWSEADIAAYLKSGLTPEFDSAGGSMARVVKETAKLTDEDRAAIAAYVKAVPAVNRD